MQAKRTTILILSLLASLSLAQTFQAQVVGVSDGDTLTVLTPSRQELRVRLHGIDAPEQSQPFGAVSRKSLSDLAFGKTVTVIVQDTDRYGRKVARIRAGELDVNLAQVKAGMAWWYRHFAKDDKELAKAEQEAWKARKGLWADPNPVAPWEWRK